jgi:hypothetical protein
MRRASSRVGPERLSVVEFNAIVDVTKKIKEMTI